jgi:hypothetical protein
MNDTSWDTVQRIDRSDIVLDALRAQLFIDLAPETYSAIGAAIQQRKIARYLAAIQQRKIARYLEARNAVERVSHAAMAVAGEFTPGFQEAAA